MLPLQNLAAVDFLMKIGDNPAKEYFCERTIASTAANYRIKFDFNADYALVGEITAVVENVKAANIAA